ncbi:MAG: hypothetical protein JW864_09545 [Spirochaetes bacterium]|nr:hypothetical protein [Spirochaetota bacterium]
MTIFGLSIIAVTGIINFLLLLFQLLSGLHVLKVKIQIHKTVGKVLFVVACLHGLIAIVFH